MSRDEVRWWLLAEDQRHQRFALALMRALRIFKRDPIKAHVAPAGRGAASDWVVHQYPALLRTTVRLRPRERVALVVLLDGDDQGVARRKAQLDEALSAAAQPQRSEADHLALIIPTWSIETWLLEEPRVSETISYKERVKTPSGADFERAARRLITGPTPGELPALDDAAAAVRTLVSRLG